MMTHIKMQSLLVVLLLCGAPMVRASDENIFETLGDAELSFKQSEYKRAKMLYSAALKSSSINVVDAQKVNRAEINLGETLLALGEFKKGHAYFDARLKNTGIQRKPLQKPWDGVCTDTSCNQLLIRGEHGIGDTFFFMRYFKQLADNGVPVTVRERGFLTPLLSRQSYIKQVVTSDAAEAAIPYSSDVYAMSLPRYVSNKGLSPLLSTQDIPYANGYIEARPDLVEKWKSRFSQQDKLHVLIGAYRASANVAGECRYLKRDCAIAALIQKLAKPHVRLYHPCGGDHRPIKRSDYELLKVEGKLGKLDELDIVEDADWHKITLLDGDFDKTSGAFEDTAAAMVASDYVVSVDTSTAMLAGALVGVKKFGVLLPKESDWRWGEGQPSTTPFFANATLFWQREQDNWSSPLEALGETIAQESEAKSSAQ